MAAKRTTLAFADGLQAVRAHLMPTLADDERYS